jgi:hypothetical protein
MDEKTLVSAKWSQSGIYPQEKNFSSPHFQTGGEGENEM